MNLYLAFVKGDRNALEEVVQLYSDSLIRFVYTIVCDFALAEDIAEDCFAKLIAKQKQFKDANHFKAYLFKTARNLSYDKLRKDKRLVSLEECTNLQDNSLTPEQIALQNDTKRIFYKCLNMLPAQYRNALYLVYIEDFGVKQSAKILKKTTKQVYNLCNRGKSSLKEILLKEGFDYENL